MDKKTRLANVIVNGLCALVWTILAVEFFIYPSGIAKRIVFTACAILWILVFLRNLYLYIKKE